jgi:hypothetical protein
MGRRIIRFSRDLFTQMLQNGERHYTITDGLPADARMVGISEHFYFATDEVAVMFESAEWSEMTHPLALVPVFTAIEPASEPPVRFREFT